MKLTNWFLNFDFSGRGRRSHSWANAGAWLAVWIVLWGLAAMVGGGSDETHPDGAASVGAGIIGLLMIIAMVVGFVDNMAMTFRRAHDTGRSGWIFLLLFIPLINLLPFYWLLIEDSHQGPNKYGPAVKTCYDPGSQTSGG